MSQNSMERRLALNEHQAQQADGEAGRPERVLESATRSRRPGRRHSRPSARHARRLHQEAAATATATTIATATNHCE